MKYTLRQARMIGEMTQLEMANELNMSKKTYIQYEKYRKILRMDDAQKFVMASKIPFEEIIFFEDQVQKFCINEGRDETCM
ncbi:helix-turn-helix transcriptional regulator [Salicibibacter cibarius]|uniref:helix-turn-helix transcriptional regulator n=1 Tax=Salicibibacter cibarius TaxID=2743000 RepID=UPI001908A8BF|nr:helix-turn-helix transcriptional regulator [Salicibibacter cibarius]